MTKPKYDHQRIEQKWQKYWEDRQVFRAEVDHEKEKYYVLDMFPYPSGAGLHVGHVTGYTSTDIIARYKRQKGFNVLHPMGWDSFGLPAEQYAIRTGTHPAETTAKNISNYRRQLKSLGFSYDWHREFATSDPKHYKWTQWIFATLYEKGLAYQAEMLVNYCPQLGTVLANEEVENGRSVEGGYPVERKALKQWVLKITAYAERLIEDLDLIDWPEHIKQLQIHWIGKSKGADIDFAIEGRNEKLTIYTTRHDTLFGATYMVIAPEHPLVKKCTTAEQKEAVEKYCRSVTEKSDLERTELNKDKTGVFTGAYAINPANQKKIPIWIADYVLISYGTGAIMAVPSGDERDFEFAQKYNLPLGPVVKPNINVIDKEDLEDITTEQYVEEVLQGKRPWFKDGTIVNSSNSELSLDGLEIEDAKKKMTAWLEKKSVGKGTVNYKLRDWLFSRQRYWGEPFPILHFEDGTKRVLSVDELPLCPPEVVDYKPAGTGESPLANVKKWVEITDPKTGKKALRETDTMPQWAGSCWYYLRFCDPLNEREGWGKEKENYWMPVDMYVGGVEHAVLHLLYSRFWHKVLYDCGYVSTKEPFQTLRNQGLVTARSFRLPKGGYVLPEEVIKKEGAYYQAGTETKLVSQIEKMSKSKLNGITPDEIVEEFGADTLRLYEVFMGPFDKEKVWNSEAVIGCRRFLNRYFDLIYSEHICEEENEESTKLIHRLVAGVGKDIEKLHFNTAIAKMMEFLNDFIPLNKYPISVLKKLTQCLSAFAPHVAEEAWQHLGEKETIAYEPFPSYDPKYLQDEISTIVVQVNGRVRGKWDLPRGKSKEEVLSFAQEQPHIQKYATGDILKVIYVPDKLLNIVVKG